MVCLGDHHLWVQYGASHAVQRGQTHTSQCLSTVYAWLALQAQILAAAEAEARLTAVGHQPRSAHVTPCMFFGTNEVRSPGPVAAPAA